jgi:peptide/nickel transport system substrate-binding protein/oligopeptide transport system substrate-binding protein
MKKILALVLAMVMCVTVFAACGKKPETTPAGTDTDATVDENDPAAALVSDAFIDPINGWSEYDELIAQIKAETDYAKRTEMMHKAEDILMSNYCVIPLYYYNDVYMQKDYVDGIYSNAFATKFFMYATMSNGSDTLRLNLASEPDFLDPALNSSVDGACLAANSFAGLYTYDADGKPAPACAESYTVSEDGLTYTVKLKEGLKWSDGSDLTAADFEYSWKRAVDPKTAADYEYMFSGFAGYGTDEGIQVTAVDDTTLEFVLSAPCAYMEDLMAFPTFYPVKKEAVEAAADWETNPGAWCQEAGFVSNGAYVCTGWSHDTSMTYEKNPYFYNADAVTINKLEFMLSADDTAIFAAYNAGNLDFADTVPTDEIAGLQESKNPEFHIVDELGTYYVAFNANSELFKDKTPAQAACMREAFSLLIDRDYICENIGQTGQVAANSYIPLGMADGNGGVFKADAATGYYDAYAINDDHEGTVAKARELLEAAGYKFGDDGKLSAETPIDIEYLTNESTGHIAVAESMQQDFGEIGINMTIQQQDWNVFLEERKNGNFDIAREGWIADFNDPINMLEMWITSSGNNDCQYGRFEGWDA